MAVMVCALLLIVASGEDSLAMRRWQSWKLFHGRSYDSHMDRQRADVYGTNLARIVAANKANLTYKLAENAFMDSTVDEFAQRYLKPRSNRSTAKAPMSSLQSFGWHSTPGKHVLATSVDWRMSGAVSAVQFQGLCGSCWSFAGVGAIESIFKIKKGALMTLSKQQIVDCANKAHGQAFRRDEGCWGGDEDTVPAYAHEYGLCLERDYVYSGRKKDSCSENTVSSCSGGISKGIVKGVKHPETYSESNLMSAVAQQPVTASINAASFAFIFYASGVLSTCNNNKDTNHAVLIVGYGTAQDGGDYWLVKNSFGAMWGEQGYIRISRRAGGKPGLCGILTSTSYPLLEDSAFVV